MTSTQVQQDNIALVRRGFEAFNSGNLPALDDLFDQDVQWKGQRTGILAGNYAGKEALFAMFVQLGKETGNSFRSVPAAFAATDDKVFVRAVGTGTRQGRSLDVDQVLLFTLADARVTEVRLYVIDQDAAAAFWA